MLVADGHVQRQGGADRAIVEVAVGILINAQDQFLLTSRPPGKVYEGYWEFPGGKLEAGESVAQALRRELREELGLHIGCKVHQWQGELEMREGQNFAWQALPVQVKPVLPGTVPVLAWLAEERGFEGATHSS
ncbi:MAG: NUDIX domain-containing protein [Betaproteobacteria bacterium]|nr:NUDIX domain-containing protein [Betaproteobacteria bacterium]